MRHPEGLGLGQAWKRRPRKPQPAQDHFPDVPERKAWHPKPGHCDHTTQQRLSSGAHHSCLLPPVGTRTWLNLGSFSGLSWHPRHCDNIINKGVGTQWQDASKAPNLAQVWPEHSIV